MAQTRAYITPIDTNGAPVTPEAPHGTYTLAANTLYYFVVGRTSGESQSVTLTGIDPTLVITSATVQGTDHSETDVTNFDGTVGKWVSDDPSAFVAVDGTGWTVSNSVVAATGAGTAGGARWNLAHYATTRIRLAVQVGAAGGAVMVSANSKAP